MERYIGLKEIVAQPLCLGDYNKKRGWTIPENEDPRREGYNVFYPDGYESWSPKETFEAAYRPIADGMTYSTALEVLKRGGRVARWGWNGKGMFIFLVPGSHFTVNRPPLLGIYPEGTEIDYHAHIDMKTAQGYIVPWLASQSDQLAEDWVVVQDGKKDS